MVGMRFDEFLRYCIRSNSKCIIVIALKIKLKQIAPLVFSTYIEVYTETRTASLDEVFFPSLVVCNVNPLRKSFMYDVLKV